MVNKKIDKVSNRIRELIREFPEYQMILSKVLSEIRDVRETEKSVVTLSFEEWDHTCGDGCCYEWGLNKTVNGEELDNQNADVETAVKVVLEHLGFNVEIKD